jgi:hypothetical protein
LLASYLLKQIWRSEVKCGSFDCQKNAVPIALDCSADDFFWSQPAGESQNQPFQHSFNWFSRVDFQGRSTLNWNGPFCPRFRAKECI